MKGVILCAGRGSRLQPLTFQTPKPLLPVGNTPIVLHAITKMLACGITEIGLVVRDGASEIQAVLGTGERLGVALTYIYQEEPKGTGHAVQTALPFIGGDSFLVYFGDNLVGDSLHGLVSLVQSGAADAAIGVKEVLDPRAFGVVAVSGSAVTQIVEKPTNPPSNLALTGIFVFAPAVAKAFADLPISSRGEIELTDALSRLIERGATVQAYRFQGWWVDVGSAARLLEANRLVLDEMDPASMGAPDAVLEHCTLIPPVTFGAGCILRNARLGPNVSIGPGVTIQDSVVEESVILAGAHIVGIAGPIRNSLIGERARVGRAPDGAMTLVIAAKSVVYVS